ncbi:MAG: IucA/IucC family protein, partial [Bacteroidota bacterium]
SEDERGIIIQDLTSLFQDLIIPFLPTSSHSTANTFLEKVSQSIQIEFNLFQNRKDIFDSLEETAHENMWQWVLDHWSKLRDGYFMMQFASLQGNPIHPLAKLRMGFHEEELIAYSPEYANPIGIKVLAVSPTICKVSRKSLAIKVKEWFSSSYPLVYDSWCKALASEGYSPDNFYPFPIHPFQQTYLAKKFPAYLEKKLIVEVKDVSIPAQATMSTRTVMPLEAGSPHIKLPLNIQTTSMLRTHSPPRVHAGPILSRLISEILAEDESLASLVRIIPEPLGIYIDDADYYLQSQNPSYFLNVLYRINPCTLISDKDYYLPLSAIFEESPFTHKPVILDILANHQANSEIALEYFQAYAWTVIRGQVGLYVGYGIALEAHQQNTGLILDAEGNLLYTLVGDLAGGVEIYEAILNMNGYSIREELHPVHKHLFSEGETPEQQILHTTFHYHLWPLAFIFSEEFGLNVGDLMRMMSKMIEQTIQYYVKNPPPRIPSTLITSYRQELERIKRVLLEEDVQVRSLLRMGLADSQNNIYTRGENPFVKWSN